MPESIKKHKNVSILIALIITGEAIFILPFVMARVFRPTMLVVFDITNTELGIFFSVYGIVAIVSYIFGGTLADRFAARNLMAIALWLTSIGGVIMFFLPSSGIMKAVYGFWGFTSIFLFWAALIRATREWGGSGFRGRAFGWSGLVIVSPMLTTSTPVMATIVRDIVSHGGDVSMFIPKSLNMEEFKVNKK